MDQSMPESGWTVKIGAEARSSRCRGRDGSGRGRVLLSEVQIEDTPVLPRGFSRSRTS